MEDKIANIESGSDFVDTVFDFWNPVEVLTVENEISMLLIMISYYLINIMKLGHN